MDLKCKKLNCKNNNAYACMCNDIKIKKNCECATFEEGDTKDKKQRQDVSKTMFETAPDIHPYRHNKDVNICCDADCMFNSECKCHANGICVNSGECQCITFVKK